MQSRRGVVVQDAGDVALVFECLRSTKSANRIAAIIFSSVLAGKKALDAITSVDIHKEVPGSREKWRFSARVSYACPRSSIWEVGAETPKKLVLNVSCLHDGTPCLLTHGVGLGHPDNVEKVVDMIGKLSTRKGWTEALAFVAVPVLNYIDFIGAKSVPHSVTVQRINDNDIWKQVGQVLDVNYPSAIWKRRENVRLKKEVGRSGEDGDGCRSDGDTAGDETGATSDISAIPLNESNASRPFRSLSQSDAVDPEEEMANPDSTSFQDTWMSMQESCDPFQPS